MCLVKKSTIHFWILSDFRIQSWIFLKKRTLSLVILAHNLSQLVSWVLVYLHLTERIFSLVKTTPKMYLVRVGARVRFWILNPNPNPNPNLGWIKFVQSTFYGVICLLYILGQFHVINLPNRILPSLYFTRWNIGLYFTGLLHESGLIYVIKRFSLY